MSTRLTFRDLQRLRQIVGVLTEEGFALFVEELRIGWLTPFRCRVRCWFRRTKVCYPVAMGQRAVAAEFPMRFRRTLERLGPTFVKFGQMLSLRPDILPIAYAEELRMLQDSVAPVPGAAIRSRVEQEFGKPIRSRFRAFSAAPVGAASIAQVHAATLSNGERVAVKVLRPGVEEIIARDLHLLRYLAELATAHVEAIQPFRPVDTIAEFAAWTIRELDLTKEAQAIDRFREMFHGDESVRIPTVDWERTTTGVLTMSFVEGMRADDRAALRKARVDVRAVARTAVRIALVQFFDAGYFHADPHPGNFVISRDGRLCLYDFGIVGHLDAATRAHILRAIAAFVERDTDRYLDAVLEIATVAPDADVAAFRRDARDAVEELYIPHGHRKRITSVVLTVVERAARHGIRFPPDFVLLGKALVTMEASALILDPALDIEAEMAPFVRALLAREASPKRLVEHGAMVARDWAALLQELPQRTRALFERFERGEVGVKLNLHELQDFKRELDRQNDIRVLTVVTVAVIAASAALLRTDVIARSSATIGRIGLTLGVILVFWLLRLVVRRS